MRLILAITLFSLSLSAQEASQESSKSPSSFFLNRQGIKELKKSNPSLAQEKFLQALSENPFSAEIHLNLGVTFQALGQMEKAKASYETALKLAQDDLTKFVGNFNLGTIAQAAKQTDEALKYYQEALKYDPASHETKVNIELLIQDQQGKGKGEGEQQEKDQKDKEGQGEGQEPKDQESKDQKEGDKEKEDKPKEYGKQPKPQPKKFDSKELSQGDVNKILGEIKQQEQKIRAEFNKKESKDRPRDKDW